MKRETFKTIILTILIAISLVFTWNIWMFQPVMQDQADTGTQVVETKKISSDEPRSLIDVVKPREMFIHSNGEHFKVDQKELFQNFWNDVSLWDVKEINDVSDQYSEQKFKNFFYGREGQGKHWILCSMIRFRLIFSKRSLNGRTSPLNTTRLIG